MARPLRAMCMISCGLLLAVWLPLLSPGGADQVPVGLHCNGKQHFKRPCAAEGCAGQQAALCWRQMVGRGVYAIWEDDEGVEDILRGAFPMETKKSVGEIVCGSELCMRGEGFHSRMDTLYKAEVARLRGGASREEMQKKMKEDREREAALQAEIEARQAKRKADMAYAEQRQLAQREQLNQETGKIVQRTRPPMPKIMSLENMRGYSMSLIQDGDVEGGEEGLRKLLTIDAEDVPTLFSLGEIMQDVRNKIPEAQEFFQRAVDSQPDHVPSLKKLAWLHSQRRFDTNEYGAFDVNLQKKRDENAEKCYRQALEAAPSDPEVLTGFGSFLWHIKEDNKEAHECFASAVQLNPTNVESNVCFARFLESARRDYTGAHLLFKRAAALNPDDLGLWWQLGRFLHKSKHDYAGAEKVYKRMLEDDPTDNDVLDALSDIYMSSKATSKALQLYREALQTGDEEADLEMLCSYARVLALANHTADAVKVARQAIALEPKHARTLCLLGKLALRGAFANQTVGKLENAERFYRAAIAADPTSSAAASACARIVLQSKNELEEVDSLYQRALQGWPRDLDIVFEYAVFLDVKMKDRITAGFMYEKVLKTNPRHVGCLNNLGAIALAHNDTFQALSLFHRCMEIEPARVAFLANYGYTLHQNALQQLRNVTQYTQEYVKEQVLARYTAACEAMEQALKMEPTNLATLNNLAFFKACICLQDAPAEQLFGKALEVKPGDVNTLSNYALKICSDGSLRKAEEMLMQVLTADPTHKEADANLQFVRRLIDKQRIFQLTQKHRMQYPTAQQPGRPGSDGQAAQDIPIAAVSSAAASVTPVYMQTHAQSTATSGVILGPAHAQVPQGTPMAPARPVLGRPPHAAQAGSAQPFRSPMSSGYAPPQHVPPQASQASQAPQAQDAGAQAVAAASTTVPKVAKTSVAGEQVRGDESGTAPSRAGDAAMQQKPTHGGPGQGAAEVPQVDAARQPRAASAPQEPGELYDGVVTPQDEGVPREGLMAEEATPSQVIRALADMDTGVDGAVIADAMVKAERNDALVTAGGVKRPVEDIMVPRLTDDEKRQRERERAAEATNAASAVVWGRGKTATEITREEGRKWNIKKEVERLAADQGTTADVLLEKAFAPAKAMFVDRTAEQILKQDPAQAREWMNMNDEKTTVITKKP